MVFEKTRAKNIPVVVTLAGGYARQVADTVSIHCNTVKVAMESAGSATGPAEQ
jgi:hypothetical protein